MAMLARLASLAATNIPLDCHEKMDLILMHDDLYGSAISTICAVAAMSRTG